MCAMLTQLSMIMFPNLLLLHNCLSMLNIEGSHILLIFKQLVNATEIHFNATQRRLLNRYNLIFGLISCLKNIAKLIEMFNWWSPYNDYLPVIGTHACLQNSIIPFLFLNVCCSAIALIVLPLVSYHKIVCFPFLTRPLSALFCFMPQESHRQTILEWK